MPTITILGTGKMGNALGDRFRNTGSSVQQLGSGDEAPITGDVVILAVPYESLEAIARDRGAELEGRIVVDITNPLDFDTFDTLKVVADGSAAAELQDAIPGSTVLKAFNTNFAGTLSSGTVGSDPTTVLVAGEDADAKETLIGLIASGGLKAIDVGLLKRARELEAIGFLQLTLANDEKIAWTAGFSVHV